MSNYVQVKYGSAVIRVYANGDGDQDLADAVTDAVCKILRPESTLPTIEAFVRTLVDLLSLDETLLTNKAAAVSQILSDLRESLEKFEGDLGDWRMSIPDSEES